MVERLNYPGPATAKAERDIAVPRFTTLHFRFQAHPDFHSQQEFVIAQESLYSDLVGSFRKGEHNILHLEESIEEKNTKWQGAQRRGFQKYGSFKKALVYAILREAHPASKIKPQHVEAATQRYFSGPDINKNNEKWLHIDLVPIVADRLIDEGYHVTPLLEPTVPNEFMDREDEIEAFAGDLMQFGYAFFGFVNQHTFRDRQVSKQLVMAVEKAEKTKQKTNIYVLRGTSHSSLVGLLPYKYKDSMYASTEHGGETDVFQEILKKSMIDGVVSPEEIRSTFQYMLDEQNAEQD